MGHRNMNSFSIDYICRGAIRVMTGGAITVPPETVCIMANSFKSDVMHVAPRTILFVAVIMRVIDIDWQIIDGMGVVVRTIMLGCRMAYLTDTVGGWVNPWGVFIIGKRNIGKNRLCHRVIPENRLNFFFYKIADILINFSNRRNNNAEIVLIRDR